MTQKWPVVTTYELENVACILDRLANADTKDINYTEYYLKDCWPGSDPDWVVSFFAKLVEKAPEMNNWNY